MHGVHAWCFETIVITNNNILILMDCVLCTLATHCKQRDNKGTKVAQSVDVNTKQSAAILAAYHMKLEMRLCLHGQAIATFKKRPPSIFTS